VFSIHSWPVQHATDRERKKFNTQLTVSERTEVIPLAVKLKVAGHLVDS
jgi:hypothetical protein